ncbi:MAG TPA: prepilin-type N-terminal cleavage/methylation domain-containing protein [Planctomycetota bacterium]|nr:prepilin-type N-terminal cleavage/methylation domain-containing protein [Planctomycetota bacterium]
MSDGTKRKGFTLIELMIVIAIIAIIAAIAIPGILSATRAANERNASSSLKTIVSAQLIFKGSDTDNNGTNDFWTADIKGLYFIAAGTPTPTPVRMIEVSLAQADGNPDPQSDYTNPPVGTLPSTPKAGYWYLTLTTYEQPKGTTNNPLGRRNQDRFGYTTVPSGYPSTGRVIFILSENWNMFKRDPGGTSAYVQTAATVPSNDPDMVLTSAYAFFPLDPFDPTNASGAWSKLD